MSDHWEVYLTLVGEERQPASVSFDYGIVEEMRTLEADTLFVIVYRFPAKDEQGFPAEEAWDALEAFDEGIFAWAESAEGLVFAGRALIDGMARCYIYGTPAREPDVRQFVEATNAKHAGTELEVKADPQREAYWDFLLPNEQEWRLINDNKVLHALEEEGDTLKRHRRVDHFFYFSEESQRDLFIQWAQKNRYKIESVGPSEDPDLPFALNIHHKTALVSPDVHEMTLTLDAKAEEYNGTYDGWVSEAVQKKDDKGS